MTTTVPHPDPTTPPDYRQLFDALLSPLLLLRPDFVIVDVNQAYLSATSTSGSDIVGRSIFDVFPDNPSDPTADGVVNLRRSLETVVATGRPDTMSIQRYDIPSDDGTGFTERYWSPVNAPVLDAAGRVAFVVHRVENVTEFVHVRRVGRAQERARAQTQMRAERMEIDLFVRAREIDEGNVQLRAANGQLEAAAGQLRQQKEAKDRFIATLSHELRNPLAAATAATEVLALDLPPGNPVLAVLERQLAILARMSDDLLDATRSLTGRLELVRQVLDFRTVVRAAVADAEPAFARTGRFLHLDLPEEPVPVDGDRLRLAQLLGNLLTNAQKYTLTGQHTHVGLHRTDGHAELTVRDEGIGFDPGQGEELFGVFTRAAPTGPSTPEGLGLGLAVVRTIAQLHDGSVSAHSEGPGMGALFRLALPCAATRETDAVAPAVRPGPDPAPSGLRILMVEDNVDLATTYRMLLEHHGHRVTCVHTGHGALKAATGEHFGLILCDIDLPDLDGHTVARRLRAAPDGDRPRMVAVSGFNGPADRARSLAAGFDAHLGKPLEIADLDTLLRSWPPDRDS
ncbi:ATP-binding protein [Streptomyces sp. NPDC051561]|uniref:hybrid sensor histidine kinase/response regulator n=1 Tax=Streptomyces sp. NPDC051561 TaxID=3365658 RepID=UPI003797EC21